jgi:hypothetical protein
MISARELEGEIMKVKFSYWTIRVSIALNIFIFSLCFVANAEPKKTAVKKCAAIASQLNSGFLKGAAELSIQHFGPKIELAAIRTTQTPTNRFVFLTGADGLSYGVIQPNEKIFGFRRPSVNFFHLGSKSQGTLQILQYDGIGQSILAVISVNLGTETEVKKGLALWPLYIADGRTGQLTPKGGTKPLIVSDLAGDSLHVMSRPGTRQFYLLDGSSQYVVIERTTRGNVNVKLTRSFEFEADQKLGFDEMGFFGDAKSGFLRFHTHDGKSGIVPIQIKDEKTGELDIFWSYSVLFSNNKVPLFVKASPQLPVVYAAYKDHYEAIAINSSGEFLPLHQWPLPIESMDLQSIDFYVAPNASNQLIAKPLFIFSSKDGKTSQVVYGETGFK